MTRKIMAEKPPLWYNGCVGEVDLEEFHYG